VKYDCYIEEYNNGKSARLRDKKTNIKISFFSKNKSDKNKLLKFMSSAKIINLDIYIFNIVLTLYSLKEIAYQKVVKRSSSPTTKS
jgi:hypothetical protein